MTDSTHITDLTAAYALGALKPEERAFVEAHVATCRDCQADLAQMNGVVSALPLACEALQPAADLGERVMRAAASEMQAKEMLATRQPAMARGRYRLPMWFGGVAAAAAIALGFVAWDEAKQREAMRANVAELGLQVTALRAANASLSSHAEHEHLVVAAIARGDYWELGPKLDQHGSTWRCAIVQPPARGHNGMLLASVPEPPRGMAYQVWLKRGGAMHKAAMVMHGGMSMIDMDMPVQRGDVIAFSVEPMQGSAAPTSPLVMETVL